MLRSITLLHLMGCIRLKTTPQLPSCLLQIGTRRTTFGKHIHVPFFVGSMSDGQRNGRLRAVYQVPIEESTTVTGKIHVDVHYYEDGNVALNTTKPVSIPISSLSAETIVSRVAATERDYQETLNRAFVQMAEEAFKNLRRQLPITRQKVEWEKVGGYRLGQDISGGKGR